MEEASGQDLDWFFRQWIYEPGYPTLEVDWHWSPDSGTVDLVIRQTQPAEWPTYRLPMEVEVRSGDRTTRETIEVDGRETRIRLRRVGEEPDAVVLDPDGWVLKGGD